MGDFALLVEEEGGASEKSSGGDEPDGGEEDKDAGEAGHELSEGNHCGARWAGREWGSSEKSWVAWGVREG